MQFQPSSPVRSFSNWINRKRHALLGTACALGLILVPLAGSAVVVGVTADRRPAVVALPSTAPPATSPATITSEAVVAIQAPAQPSTGPAAPLSQRTRAARREGRGR